jgi:hypothetical protein
VSVRSAKGKKETSRKNRRGVGASGNESSEPVRLKSPVVEPSLKSLDELEADTLAIGITSDGRPLTGAAGFVDWRLCGQLSKLIVDGTITGAAGEKVLVPTGGRIPVPRLLLFGWGERDRLDSGATDRMKWMVEVLEEAGAEKVAVALPEPAHRLLSLVDEHLGKPLGDKLACVFEADATAPPPAS